MKRVLYSVCIGSLALALTAWGAQTNDRRPDRAKAQRTANVRATTPAHRSSTMSTHRNFSTAQYRQRAQITPRTSSHAVVNRDARMRTYRERTLSSNRDFGARRNVAVNRERELAVNRARNVDVNRHRDTDQFRARNNLTVNRNRNVAANRTRKFAYYRGGNVRINNNFRSAAFRGQQYTVFRNYHRQWHDRSWWRSHYDRIIFVNGGWYYWNTGYWFPAWGYDPYVTYAYDGPIYAYNGWSPDRVIVDVQEQLQRDGYYDGPIDGILGPTTREAIAAFQADNGLAVTSVIDEPTLATLGIA